MTSSPFASRRSLIQEQFLFSSEILAPSPAYMIGSLTELRGLLDEPRLRHAWSRVFRAHTCLHFSLQEPRNAVPEAPWKLVDAPAQDVSRLALEENETPFSVSDTSLVRFVVYRVSSDHWFLQIVLHHALTDLFSKTLLSNHLSLAYSDPEFLPQTLPYDLFIDAEKAYLESEAGKKSREFWAKKMNLGFEVLRLPGSTVSPLPFTGRGRRLPWLANGQATEVLNQAESSGKSPFLLLLAAYVALLFRLTGQKRFLIGVPFSNRQQFGEQPLPGACVNILPLLVDLNGELTLAEVYSQIRREMLENHRNQSFPFLEVARLYPPGDHDPVRPRMLQVGFTNEPPMSFELDGVTCRAQELPRTGAQMDLFFTWWKDGADWKGNWEYNASSFSENDVLVWQQAYNRVLEAFLERPDSELGEVPLLSQGMISSLSEGPRDSFPLDRGMDDLLREAFGRHAQEVALVHRGQKTTYGEFARAVRSVASSVAKASPRGSRVAVLVERGPEMLFALHGIVQAGSAYVPLGIDWPQNRLADILADLQPSLILTQAAFADRFESAKVPVAIVSDLLQSDDQGRDFPPRLASPEDPMYLLFTSGTTGRPKAAVLPHRGIVNRLYWMQKAYPLSVGDRCLLKTPYTFDVSGWELFWPFLFGATLVILEEHAHKDPTEVCNAIKQNGVRIVHFVPSMLSHFIDDAKDSRLESLTDVVASGEALTPELVARFLASLPGVKLHNLYGPTEASIDVSFWRCSENDVQRGTIPIGRPISNTQIYVLDERMRPCPPLVRGEIYLGGVGLASGYWNREELTNERFVAHPFAEGRLYKTGDWGRFGLDGAIEYLERKDNQIKIRGLRVELGEVEAPIRELEDIENVVVKKSKSSSGSDILVAYYVTRSGSPLRVERIKEALRSRLPEAIIPEVYVPLSNMPMSENGKIDRKALPEVTAYEPPPPSTVSLTGAERVVAELWLQVTGTLVHDSRTNFFDAGGNSLSLLTLRTLLESSFETRLKVTDLFRQPTILGMVELLSGQSTQSVSEQDQSSLRARHQNAILSKIVRNKRSHGSGEKL